MIGIGGISMSWSSPVQASIDSLLFPDRQFSQPAQQAIEHLKRESGKDFGDNVAAWVRWAKENGHVEDDYPEEVIHTNTNCKSKRQ